MLVCRETDSLGCVNCVEKGWNKMENKVTVVLADANEEFRTMLRQRMEGTGEFHVAGSTENGDQALDLVRRLRPQLLVTDVVLPGLDGFGLLRQLNQLGQGAPRTSWCPPSAAAGPWPRPWRWACISSCPSR